VPLYFSNSSTLNLGGIMTSNTRHNPAVSANPQLTLRVNMNKYSLNHHMSYVFCLRLFAHYYLQNTQLSNRLRLSKNSRPNFINVHWYLSQNLLSHIHERSINGGRVWYMFLLVIFLMRWYIAWG